MTADRLLRVTFLTPANFGAAAGEAALDRPTQKAEDSGLPYVPDSALKGVLAGEHGDVGDDRPNAKREDLYGSPDRGSSPGAASRIVFGNADLLGFPLATEDGGTAHVVPAESLGRFLWLENATERYPEAVGLLAVLEAKAEQNPVLALPDWPAIPRRFELYPLAAYTGPRALAELTSLLTRYAGRQPTAAEPFVVVPSPLAARLWPHAAELRTGTALDHPRRVVREATLRVIELIPAGSVFLSLLTSINAPLASPQQQAQLGAGEGNGLGWAELSWIDPPDDSAEAASAAGPPSRSIPFDEAACMIDLHAAVRDLAHDESLWGKAYAAAGNLGGRIQYSGLEAALAFELAKAKPAHGEPSAEARAHRWLLARVLGLAPETGAKQRAETLLAHLQQGFLAPGSLEGEREVILTRWLWLRRFMELGGEATGQPTAAEVP
jgi:CRISPR/Cas system CMR subunit Cmr4 (Cas7 group RAMP superfamily)